MTGLLREAPLVAPTALSAREAIRVTYPRPGALSLIPTVTLACVACDRNLAFTHTTPEMSIIAQRAALADWEVTESHGTVIVTCPTHTEPHTKAHYRW